MQTILILGAGKSSTYLIDYLMKSAGAKNRKIIVADISEKTAADKIKRNPFASAVSINVSNPKERNFLIQKFDLVISLGVLHHTNNCHEAIRYITSFNDQNSYLFLGLYHKYGREPFLNYFKN